MLNLNILVSQFFDPFQKLFLLICKIMNQFYYANSQHDFHHFHNKKKREIHKVESTYFNNTTRAVFRFYFLIYIYIKG